MGPHEFQVRILLLLAALLRPFEPNLTRQKTCVSVLFVGLILTQVPSNAILNKIGRPAAYLTGCMTVWVRQT